MSSAQVDLVIMRHGEAEAYAASDSERALTPAGQLVVQHQAQLIKSLDFMPEAIIHSPFLRTVQTAEIVQQVFPDVSCYPDSALLYTSEPEQVPFLWQDKARLLLVSHMPLVGRLCSYLCPQAKIRALNVAGFVRLSVNLNSLESELVHDASGSY